MTAVPDGIPATRPGSVNPGDQGLIDRIRQLEAMVAELQRKDMTNSTVGQGGTFRGFYDNGNLAFTFGKDKTDGIRKAKFYWPSTGNEAYQIGPGNPNSNPPELEQMRFRDQAGNKLFATDGIAGYGLAEPSFTYLMCPVDSFARTTGVEDFAAECNAFFYNPGVISSVRITNLSGITGGTARLVAIDGNGITQVSSSSFTFGAGISVAQRVILLPSSMINAQNCKLQWKITPTGSGTLQCWPLTCKGVSKSFYDIDSGDR